MQMTSKGVIRRCLLLLMYVVVTALGYFKSRSTRDLPHNHCVMSVSDISCQITRSQYLLDSKLDAFLVCFLKGRSAFQIWSTTTF